MSINNKPKTFTVLALGGRTGGPLIPILAIIDGLQKFKKENQQIKTVIIGVSKSFEEKLAKDQKILFELLPEVKFTLGSFKNSNYWQKLKELVKLPGIFFSLISSFFKSLRLLKKYQPDLILSTGSFLAVPVLWAAKLTNIIKLTKTKILIHQQDPDVGLANKLTSVLADKLTCVFDYTKNKFSSFKRAEIIPNPINTDRFDNLDVFFINPEFDLNLLNLFKDENLNLNQENLNLDLLEFLKKHLNSLQLQKKTKPLLLVFGGASGSQFINYWLWQNLDTLLKFFKIIHLIGVLQKEKDYQKIPKNKPDYFALESLFTQMPLVLNLADLVICRAGLSSITELLYLQKAAFLVPLADSHQEVNAREVSSFFYILDQKRVNNWVTEILENYPKFFEKIKYPTKTEVKTKLKKYYQEVYDLLNS